VQEGGETLSALHVAILREATRSGWLEIVLDEGRNRQIRRMLTASGYTVERLVRVAIGALELGALPKAAWRRLSPEDLAALFLRATARR
jgi:23S rRNA pseudouridine2605 synthase